MRKFDLMATDAVTRLTINKLQDGIVTQTDDLLATEEPLEIRLVHGAMRQKKNLAVTMRTPNQDEALAIGFLYTEGIIKQIADVQQCEILQENVIQVHLAPTVDIDLKSIERNFYTTSSCGVCGKSSIDAVRTECTIYDKAKPFAVDAATIHGLPATLQQHQKNFQETGGIHAAALFDKEGQLINVCEDVGRHNALDKLIGMALQQDMIPLQQHILLLSGRASFELVQKATMAGIKIIVAVGAPSSLAVATADEFGITLIGFAKNNRFNIYCNADSIAL